jgi:hypothetical protein
LTLEEYRPLAIFKILDQYSSRWRNLYISIPPVLFQFVQQPDCLPLLEQLHINSSSKTFSDPCHIISFSRAPCLNTVEVERFRDCIPLFPYIGIHWDTVTHLSVMVSRDSLFSILLLNPQLVHCTFEVCGDSSTSINPFLESQIGSS